MRFRPFSNYRFLYLSRDSELDTLLAFLNSVPAEALLGVYGCIEYVAILYKPIKEPKLIRQRDTCVVLRQLILRSVARITSNSRKQQVILSANKRLDDILLPLRSGPILRLISSIGALISCAATSGYSYSPDDRPPRTPTECLAALQDMLDVAAVSAREYQLLAVLQNIRRGEDMRLRNMLDIESIKFVMRKAENDFSIVGLHRLKDGAHALWQELRSHGPSGPPLTRLFDNVYGRVWETLLNDALINNIPPKVLQSARIMRDELLKLVHQIPEDLQAVVIEKFSVSAKNQVPRSWSDKDERLLPFIRLKTPSRKQFEDFLRAQATTGYEMAGDYFVGSTLFDVLKDTAPDQFSWKLEARWRYQKDIIPLKGKQKFMKPCDESKRGSGITLRYHPPARQAQNNVRPVLTRVWDLDVSRQSSVDSVNILVLKRGVPYGTGISGYTHLFVFFFVHVKKTVNIDLLHALLGLLIFLVHDGGHTWNEGLQAINYLEGEIGLGIMPKAVDPHTFVSDYSNFIKIFEGTDTKDYLVHAVRNANEQLISYRRHYTANLCPEIECIFGEPVS